MYLRAVFSFAIVLFLTVAAHADTTFTYQGELQQAGTVANGPYDMDFTLWNALTEGGQIGATINLSDVLVVDGIFTVELDYGAAAFYSSERWLEIVVNSTTLSPRQPITRTPYSIQTRGIVVDENNNVGIGTSTPNYPLQVETDGSIAIWGLATASSGQTAGVYGLSDSTAGNGVIGFTSALTGDTIGVWGFNDSTAGRGVMGWARALTGETLGVWGQSLSNTGRGVYGDAKALTGETYGVYGKSLSSSGRGVYGLASATSGTTVGVYGQNSSTAGYGVYGVATTTSGNTYGVSGASFSSSGRGVYGKVTDLTGDTFGVYGISESIYGVGVFGKAAKYGVFGESQGTNGRGVYGSANALTGTTYGVYGRSQSTGGRGVYGLASRTTGITYGGWFESYSPTGRAIFGLASANSGVNYGVVGHSNSSSGFDFYASGAGANYGSNSSRRWKSNVVPIGDSIIKLAQLRGVYFDWDAEHGGAHDVGMIAEEVGAVMPEIVQYEENGEDAIGMDYSKLTPLLVEAVNALHVENETLQHEIVAGRAYSQVLEERLERLEAMLLESN